jgi:hypothetical protein
MTATIYHLNLNRRTEKNATAVIPVSELQARLEKIHNNIAEIRRVNTALSADLRSDPGPKQEILFNKITIRKSLMFEMIELFTGKVTTEVDALLKPVFHTERTYGGFTHGK